MTKLSDGSFVPTQDMDKAKCLHFKQGEGVLFVTANKIRNPKYHRRFWALVSFAYDNYQGEDKISDIEHMEKRLLMMSGVVDEVGINGVIKQYPKSVKYEKMGEEEFQEVYSRVFDTVCEHWYVDKADLNQFITEEEERLMKFMPY